MIDLCSNSSGRANRTLSETPNSRLNLIVLVLFQNKQNLAAKFHQLHLLVGRKAESIKYFCCYSIILYEKSTPIKGRMTLSECSQCRMCGKEFKGKKCLLKHEAQHLNDLGLANAEKLGQMGPPLASVEAGQLEDSQYRCRYVHVVRH